MMESSDSERWIEMNLGYDVVGDAVSEYLKRRIGEIRSVEVSVSNDDGVAEIKAMVHFRDGAGQKV
jgi:hypothetical protein